MTAQPAQGLFKCKSDEILREPMEYSWVIMGFCSEITLRSSLLC